MRLIHKKTGKEVAVGDKITSFRGEETTVQFFREPHAARSSGKVVTAEDREFYVGVYGMEWVDRDDR